MSDKKPVRNRAASLGKVAVAATGDDKSDAGGITIDVEAGVSFTIIKATACEAARGAIAGAGAGIGEWRLLGSGAVAARGIIMR